MHIAVVLYTIAMFVSVFSTSVYRTRVPFSGLIRKVATGGKPYYRVNSKTKDSKQLVNISTYNVLSSHLCEADYFLKCNPKYLDKNYRLELLKGKLKNEISINSIICLQEVSAEWAGLLHTFFASNNYYFVTALYGKKFDGRMGVGIAIPLSHYSIADVDITTLSECDVMNKQLPARTYAKKADSVPSAPAPAPVVDSKGDDGKSTANTSSSTKGWLNTFKKLLSISSNPIPIISKPPCTPPAPAATYPRYQYEPLVGQALVWSEALKRHNQVISVRLQSKTGGTPFYVSTYHMPCNFRTPAVMLVHTMLLLQHVQSKISAYQELVTGAGSEVVDVPSIITGDFNFKPGSLMYDVITNNKYVGKPIAMDTPSPTSTGSSSSYYTKTVKPRITVNRNDIEDIFRVGVPPAAGSDGTSSGGFGNGNDMSIEKFDWKLKSTHAQGNALYKSVYREKLGAEPDFTNYATTRAGGSSANTSRLATESIIQLPFIDTLDYIFVSNEHWNVECVKALPHRMDVLHDAGVDMERVPDEKDLVGLSTLYNNTDNVMSFPTQTEPSDHILLSATLSLK